MQDPENPGPPDPINLWHLGLKIAAIILAATVVVCLVRSFNVVPTGSRGVITSFGKIAGIEDEGLHVIAPWKTLTNFSIRSESVDIVKAEGATNDQQPVHVNLTVRYSIKPDEVGHVFEQYSHTGDINPIVQTASQEMFKAVTAKYSAPELISKRTQVSNDIVAILQSKLDKFGGQVISVDVTNFAFSDTYQQAINEKTTQEQKKLAADNKYLTVQSEQKQVVAVAEAEASAQRARADGAAYARTKNAEAEAHALEVQNEALARNKDVLELRRIEVALEQARIGQKWNGVLPTSIYAGAPMPFINSTPMTGK